MIKAAGRKWGRKGMKIKMKRRKRNYKNKKESKTKTRRMKTDEHKQGEKNRMRAKNIR